MEELSKVSLTPQSLLWVQLFIQTPCFSAYIAAQCYHVAIFWLMEVKQKSYTFPWFSPLFLWTRKWEVENDALGLEMEVTCRGWKSHSTYLCLDQHVTEK